MKTTVELEGIDTVSPQDRVVFEESADEVRIYVVTRQGDRRFVREADIKIRRRDFQYVSALVNVCRR